MKIEVTNTVCKLSQKPSDDIVEKIREQLRYKNDADNHFTRRKNRYSKYQIAEFKYLYHKGTRKFATGLLSIVEKVFKDNKVKYEIEDKRPVYPILNPLPLLVKSLRDYQADAKKIVLEHKDCMTRMATGGGKTLLMASIVGELNGYKTIIFVRRQMLLVQTIKVFEEELGIKVGQLGAGIIDIQPVTVAMIPTVARSLDPKWKFKKTDDDDEDDKTKLSLLQKQEIREYVDSCESLIVDEAHCLGAETAQLVSNAAVSARYRMGFSATDWREDGKDLLLTAATGPRVVDIDASYLIERGYLVPPHIYFFKTPATRIPLAMQGKYPDVYKEFIVENVDRNALILSKAIDAYNRFEHVLILVQQIEHGRILLEYLEEEGVWAEYISGKSTMVARQEIITQFEHRSRSILIASSILNEGVDIPAISVLINAAGGKSATQYYQKIGRALRPHKDKERCIIVDFHDQNIKFLSKHSKRRIWTARKESLYKLKIQDSTETQWQI